MSTELGPLFEQLRSILDDDLLDQVSTPQICCRPTTAKEVARIVAVASSRGARCSVGQSSSAEIHLDLRHLNQLLRVDEVSLLCEAQAGITLYELEHGLRGHGLSLGPIPAPSWRRTLGAALSAPRPSEASLRLGRLRDRPIRLGAVLTDGTELATPLTLAPRRASGPDLKQLLIGTHGLAGTITSAVLPVARTPETTHCAGWLFSTARAALDALTGVARMHGGSGPASLVLVSDDLLLESGVPVKAPGGRAALFIRMEGPGSLVAAQLQQTEQFCHDMEPLPQEVSGLWLGADPSSENMTRLAHLWPHHQQVFSWPSAGELEGAYNRLGPRRIVCGVHLFGLTLCGDPTSGDAPGTMEPESTLQSLEKLLFATG